MISFIIWVIGVVLAIKAIMDVVKLPMSTVAKALVIIILFLTSWLGLIFYYLYAKDKLVDWFKDVK